MGSLDGKVALVTGGSSGIGLATTRLFTDEGARTVVVDLQAPPEGVGDVVVEGDVGDPTVWPGIVERVEQELGGLDIAYLNAGVTTGEGDIERLTDVQYERITRVNVDSLVYGVRAVVPAMVRRGGGAIAATASLAGLVAFAPDPVYSLTKHAVVGFCRSVAPQLAARKITINAICPGITDTPLVGPEGRSRLTAAGFPLIPPSDIAAAVLLAVTGTRTGEAYACQPGRGPVLFEFRQVPGPRAPGAQGMRPPTV
jgi:NAD(P)-dependent dehydrogenase (short-subunit alcohol dehydrogenase family)